MIDRLLLFLAGAALCVNTAGAVNLGRIPEPKASGGIYTGGGRVGGETMADATEIPALPFADSGNTCGYANDYDVMCPYGGSTSPDVVYRYVASMDGTINLDLCASEYDTKIYVFEDAAYNMIACNDDAGCGYSGYQSRLEGVSIVAGHTYYVIVDGYTGACGTYALSVEFFEPCNLDCPPGAQTEGEPACVDQYFDDYNPGCAGDGGYLQDWTPIFGGPDGCATMCGRSCTYLYNGLSYRDTDWYRVAAAGGPLTMECTAEFPVLGFILYGTDCNNLQYTYGTAPTCATLNLQWTIAPYRDTWLWVGPSGFTGVPSSRYLLHVCGIGPTPSVPGACCVGGDCFLESSAICDYRGGTWGGPEVTCDPDPCGHVGACCLADGSCVMATMSDCLDQAGSWRYPVETCTPDPCGPVPVETRSWGRIKNDYR